MPQGITLRGAKAWHSWTKDGVIADATEQGNTRAQCQSQNDDTRHRLGAGGGCCLPLCVLLVVVLSGPLPCLTLAVAAYWSCNSCLR